jgi:hypothetical protein
LEYSKNLFSPIEIVAEFDLLIFQDALNLSIATSATFYLASNINWSFSIHTSFLIMTSLPFILCAILAPPIPKKTKFPIPEYGTNTYTSQVPYQETQESANHATLENHKVEETK